MSEAAGAPSSLGPDWVLGDDGLYFRRGARVLLLDDADRLLLVRGHDLDQPERSWWFTVGGGVDPGESDLDAAVREVREETGMDCRPGVMLPTVRYTVGDVPKEVRYWEAEATGGAFTPGDEVDRLLWLPPEEARERLTRDQDRELVDALLTVLPHELL